MVADAKNNVIGKYIQLLLLFTVLSLASYGLARWGAARQAGI